MCPCGNRHLLLCKDKTMFLKLTLVWLPDEGSMWLLSVSLWCSRTVLSRCLQIVLYREEEVLECECDMAMVHHLLSQIPQDLPYETLISRAGDLFVQFPPSELAKEAASHERYLKRIQSCLLTRLPLYHYWALLPGWCLFLFIAFTFTHWLWL